jgi:hypothetical protein
MADQDGKPYRARMIAMVDAEALAGPWVEYGATNDDDVERACDASARRLLASLSTLPLRGEAEKVDSNGRWPSDG